MISNEKRYRHARALLARFEIQLERVSKNGAPDGVHPDLHRGMVAGLQEQVETLRGQLADYELLRQGQKPIEVQTLAELPTALIKARIARGWTQRQLAERLGLKEQQIQRYETQRYKGVAFERMHQIASRLGVKVSVRFDLLDARSDMTEWEIASLRRASLALVVDSFRSATGEPIRGRLKLQKLMLLWSEAASNRLGSVVFGHKPLHYGGYDDELNDDIEVMRAAGMLTVGAVSAQSSMDDEDQLLARVVARSRANRQDEAYELTRAGLEWLRGFVGTDALVDRGMKEELVRLARRLASDESARNVESLIDETYEKFPMLTERSRIKRKVVARLRRRARRG